MLKIYYLKKKKKIFKRCPVLIDFLRKFILISILKMIFFAGKNSPEGLKVPKFAFKIPLTSDGKVSD